MSVSAVIKAKSRKRSTSTAGGKSAPPATNAPDPYATQIGSETELRYAPEVSALRSSLGDVIAARASSIASARSAAEGAIQTSRLAAPGLKAIETDALGQIDAAIGQQTPGLTADLARTRTRLAERMALAGADNTARQTAAAAGYQGAVTQANATAADQRTKIQTRLQEIGHEAGVYGSGREAELAKDDADRAAADQRAADQNTASLMAAGVDPATGQILPGGVKDPAANGRNAATQARERARSLASPEAVSKAAGEIQRAMAAARRFQKAGLSRAESARLLLNGVAESGGDPLYTQTPTRTGGVSQDRQLNPDGTQAATPKSAALDPVSPLWASIALDMTWDGGVSRNNVRRLHNPRSRYSLQELNDNGLNLVSQRQRSRAEQAASAAGSAVSSVAGSVAGKIG